MKIQRQLIATSLLAAALPLAQPEAQANRVIRTHLSPTGGVSDEGARVAAMGDIDLDGVPDYVTAAPTASVGGNSVGLVRAFSGLSGLLLWTANGNAVVVGGVVVQEAFGASLAALPDLDGDGITDLVVGAPSAAQPGVTPIPFTGRIDVLSGASGMRIAGLTQYGAGGDFLGLEAVSTPDISTDLVADVVVLANGYGLILASGATFFQFPLQSGETDVSFAGDFDGDTLAHEIALGAPGADQVRVVNVLTLIQTVITGPSGSQLGGSLAYHGGIGLVAGAYGSSTVGGSIWSITPPGNLTLLSSDVPGSLLGHSLATGGDVDGDGLEDILAGRLFSASVRALAASGATIGEINTGNVTLNGFSLAFIGDLGVNGMDEFLVGDWSFAGASGWTQVFHGGPTATLNNAFGPGCPGSSGNVPALTLSNGLMPGMPFTLAHVGTPNALAVLYFGLQDPVGTGFGNGCTLWLQLSGLTQFATFVTSGAGAWTSPVYTVPLTANLLGLPAAFQVVEVVPELLASNACASTIGW